MDFNFKLWMEIVEPKKPIGARKKHVTKNKGSNTAYKVIQYEWTTSLGNKITLIFRPNGAVNPKDSYELSFYVNNALYDDAKLDNTKRDPEILSGFFTMAKDKAKKLGIKRMWYDPVPSKKILKDLPIEPHKTKTIQLLNEFIAHMQNYNVIYSEPNEVRKELYKRLGRPVPEKEPNINKEKIIESAQEAIRDIKLGYMNYLIINDFHDLIEKSEELNFDTKKIHESLNKMYIIFNSNSEYGHEIRTNKRESIFSKLFQRYFSDEWNIDGNTLTRKEEIN